MINKDTLVLSGGGIKGIGYIGVLKALEEKNILKNIKTIAGTSVGGIMGVLLVLGYKYDELKELMITLDFGLIRSVSLERFIKEFGVDDGARFEFLLEKLFEMKKVKCDITFQELYIKTGVEIILTSVCVNKKELIYISHHSHPNMKVITGIRMTSSVPFWFIPVKYNNDMYIDGGIMDNYPINYFKDKIDKVIGVYLVIDNKNVDEKIVNWESYLFGTMDSIFNGIVNIQIDKYKSSTIKLELPNVKIFDLSVPLEEKHQMIDIGYKCTISYINELEKIMDNNKKDSKNIKNNLKKS